MGRPSRLIAATSQPSQSSYLCNFSQRCRSNLLTHIATVVLWEKLVRPSPNKNTRTATSDDWFSFEMPFQGCSVICRRCAWRSSHRTGSTHHINFLAPIAQSSKDHCALYEPKDSGVSVQRPTLGHDFRCIFVRLVIVSLWSRLAVPLLTGEIFEPDLTADHTTLLFLSLPYP